MNILPNEVLYQVFTHLPHRCIFINCLRVCKKWNAIITQPSFYSTMNIHSQVQLEKLIQLAKEKITMNQIPITFHVKQLIIHYDHWAQNVNTNDIIVIFPNLQDIDILHNESNSGHFYKSRYIQSIQFYKPIYLMLNQPTHFIYCDYNEKWMIKFNQVKKQLKSLHIYMLDKSFSHFIPEQQQKQFDPIHLNCIGKKRKVKNEIEMTSITTTIPINVLIISTTSNLSHLTCLKIDFYTYWEKDYIINELTFEHIHETCPLLEFLSISKCWMDMFDKYDPTNEYYIDNNSLGNSYKPANRLTKIIISESIFDDPRCFSYFSNKYPNVESLSIDFWFQSINGERVPVFKQAIYNMLLQFRLLKKVSFHHEIQYSDSNWLNSVFLTWFYEHSHQLTHLDYADDLVIDKTLKEKLFNNRKDIVDDINLGNLLLNVQQLQPQFTFTFLHYLTNLTLSLKNMIHLALTYFLQSPHSTIVSKVLKNLSIEKYLITDIDKLYIYDWLDVFPNLISLKLSHIYIYDNWGDDNEVEDGEDKDEIHQDSNHLHQLINQHKQHKQQQQKQLQDDLNKENEINYYKLKKLHLWDCKIRFKNGFDEFLKRCSQLKRLKLESVTFIHSPMLNQNEVHFNLSHLCLAYLYVNGLYYSSLIQYTDFRILERLIIHETLTDDQYIFIKDKMSNIINELKTLKEKQSPSTWMNQKDEKFKKSIGSSMDQCCIKIKKKVFPYYSILRLYLCRDGYCNR
ncbi:unnamed protein product [Cunninghamella blakesleeana]